MGGISHLLLAFVLSCDAFNHQNAKISENLYVFGDGQDKPTCFRPDPDYKCMYDPCVYHTKE